MVKNFGRQSMQKTVHLVRAVVYSDCPPKDFLDMTLNNLMMRL